MKKHPVSVEVRFKDIDLAGHLHHSVYLLFMEQARMSFFAEFVPLDHDWRSQGLVIARVEIDHIARIGLNDKVQVDIWCEHVGNRSLKLAYEIYKNEGVLCSRSATTLVGFDFVNEVSVPIPDHWRTSLLSGQP